MSPYDELQCRVLELPLVERSRIAIAVIDSLDEDFVDPKFEVLTEVVLERSAKYARGELQAQDWRVGLEAIQSELDQADAS